MTGVAGLGEIALAASPAEQTGAPVPHRNRTANGEDGKPIICAPAGEEPSEAQVVYLVEHKRKTDREWNVLLVTLDKAAAYGRMRYWEINREQLQDWDHRVREIPTDVAAAVQQARLEALEEACKVVRKWNFMACSDADGLEAEIRALERPAAIQGGTREEGEK